MLTAWLFGKLYSRSRISQIGGANPKELAPTYYLAKIVVKTTWKWRNSDQEGRVSPMSL